MIYLDHNATTSLRPGVLEAMLPWLSQHPGNASSVHRFGRLARDAVEQARAQVAEWIGAQAEEVIFTSGATEANNWALQGLRPGAPRLVGSTEHDAVLQAVPHAPRLPVRADGCLDAPALQKLLQQARGGVLSLMAANNETGVLHDLEPVIQAAQSQDVWVHSDATQAVGRMRMRFDQSGLAALSCSAHKLGGPKGVGALVLRRGVGIGRGQRGGPHERGLRAGTLNVPGIVGFGAACAALVSVLDAECERLARWRDGFEAELRGRFADVRIFGADAARLPHTSFFALPGWHSEALLMALDKRGLALASGSACHSGSDVPSHVLAAMGLPTEVALGAVRMSLGHDSSEEDVQALLQALEQIVQSSSAGSAMAGVLNR